MHVAARSDRDDFGLQLPHGHLGRIMIACRWLYYVEQFIRPYVPWAFSGIRFTLNVVASSHSEMLDVHLGTVKDDSVFPIVMRMSRGTSGTSV